MKRKVISKGSVVDKDIMIDSSVEVEEDKKEDDNKEREDETNDDIAEEDEKVSRKRTPSNMLVSSANEKKVKKRKKEKRDHMMLPVDKETKLEKKKKKRNKKKNHDVVAARNKGRDVEKVNGKRSESSDMKARNKDKKRKENETKDVVIAGNEERNKLKVRNENKKEKVNNMDSGEVSVDKKDLLQGKWFSKEEDESIKKAVSDYIESKQLGDDGLKLILNCKSFPEVRGCWEEIGDALPWRPNRSIYQRAHRLYEQGERKWTSEEVKYIRKSYKKYGPKWRKVADKLGKCPAHVRSAFQRYQFGNLKNGKWSQHEYQTLFDLVNKDLQEKFFEEKKSIYGMLKDNIGWEAISWELGTRFNGHCCIKWYNQLTSPMVAEGKWADVDDYRLVMVLVELDASCEEEVDWNNLLDYRSGDLCRKRWLQMVRHLGEHGNKTFSEQVEVLSERYRPDLAQVRDAMDARPIVD